MGGVSYAELAAAVSNAGGYGVLGMAGTDPDFIRGQMRRVRELTDKPFGVDLLAASPESLTASVEVIIEEGASCFIAGLGVPMPIMQRLKAAGLKVMVVCGAVRHAEKAEQAGCDAVICQGGEGGGHTGLVGTLPLVAQAVERVSIPVVAAGGLYDGRGLAAALALGAQGVWMGTRFIASPKRTRGSVPPGGGGGGRHRHGPHALLLGQAMRVRQNAYVEDWERRPADIQPFPQQAIQSSRAGVMGGIGGQIERPRTRRSCFAMGQTRRARGCSGGGGRSSPACWRGRGGDRQGFHPFGRLGYGSGKLSRRPFLHAPRLPCCSRSPSRRRRRSVGRRSGRQITDVAYVLGEAHAAADTSARVVTQRWRGAWTAAGAGAGRRRLRQACCATGFNAAFTFQEAAHPSCDAGARARYRRRPAVKRCARRGRDASVGRGGHGGRTRLAVRLRRRSEGRGGASMASARPIILRRVAIAHPDSIVMIVPQRVFSSSAFGRYTPR
jgi:enoyl-[acyl-carrier protein] reductase II